MRGKTAGSTVSLRSGFGESLGPANARVGECRTDRSCPVSSPGFSRPTCGFVKFPQAAVEMQLAVAPTENEEPGRLLHNHLTSADTPSFRPPVLCDPSSRALCVWMRPRGWHPGCDEVRAPA